MLEWVMTAHHVLATDEFGLFLMGASLSLFYAGVTWLFYIGLESYVRRRWPSSMISWSRVVAGKFRDPLVGRDILTCTAVGVGLCLWELLRHLAEGWFGKLPPRPDLPAAYSAFSGVRNAIGFLPGGISWALAFALFLFLQFYLLRLLFRKDWVAGGVFVLIFAGAVALSGHYPLVGVVFVLAYTGGYLFALKRFGLLALVAVCLVTDVFHVFFLRRTSPPGTPRRRFSAPSFFSPSPSLLSVYRSPAGRFFPAPRWMIDPPAHFIAARIVIRATLEVYTPQFPVPFATLRASDESG
jgi:hypothetical protein